MNQKFEKKPGEEQRDIQMDFADFCRALEQRNHDEYVVRATQRNTEHRSLFDIIKNPHPTAPADIAEEMATRHFGDLEALLNTARKKARQGGTHVKVLAELERNFIERGLAMLEQSGTIGKKTGVGLERAERAHARADLFLALVRAGQEDKVHAFLRNLEKEDEYERSAFTDEFCGRIEARLNSATFNLPVLDREAMPPDVWRGNLSFDKRFKKNQELKEDLEELLRQQLRLAAERLIEKFINQNDADRFISFFNFLGNVLDSPLLKGSERQRPIEEIHDLRSRIAQEVMRLWKEGLKTGDFSQEELLFKTAMKFGIFGRRDVDMIAVLKEVFEHESGGAGPFKDRQ